VKPLTAPMPFEVVTGYGSKRQVVHTHSIAEADRVYRAQLKGSTPAIYLGNLLIRGQP
jgi:hypothetical protein